MKIREEIRLFSTEGDKPVLNWLFDHYHFAPQWGFVAKCDLFSYGVESYKVNRVWSPTNEGLILFKHSEKD